MINNKHLGGEWIAPAEFAEVQHRDFATAAHMEAICGNAGHIGQCQPLLDYSCKDVLLNPQTPCWPTPPSCLIKPIIKHTLVILKDYQEMLIGVP